jgi:hypothetical protein
MVGQLLQPPLERFHLDGAQQPAERGSEGGAGVSISELSHQLCVVGVQVAPAQVEEDRPLARVGEEGERVVDPPDVARTVNEEVGTFAVGVVGQDVEDGEPVELCLQVRGRALRQRLVSVGGTTPMAAAALRR